MYIIYQGEVGVYVDEDCSDCVQVLGENKIFGESPESVSSKLEANFIAHTNTKVLVLHQIYYKNIIKVSKVK